MDLEAILRALCAEVPDAIGAVLADADGESITTVRGAAPLPAGAHSEARRHIPRALDGTVAIDVFALRLAGAEPSPIMRALDERAATTGSGAPRAYEVRYRDLDTLVMPLDEGLYVALFVVRNVRRARALAALARARDALAGSI